MSPTSFNANAAKQASATREASAQKKAEAEKAQQQLIYLFAPADVDAHALDGHHFEFLFSNKPQKDSKYNIAQGLEEARQTQMQFKDLGTTAGVTAKIWGPGSTLQPFDIEKNNPFETLSPNRNFAAPAEYIMNEARAGRSKNYIVVTDGNLYAGNVKEVALSLSFLSLTPGATLDFIVPGNAPADVDKLLAAVQCTPAAKQVHVTKVPSASYVSLGLQHVIKDRVMPPEPAQKPAAKPKPQGPKLFGIFPINY
jgi:hypothetical protein